MNLLNIHEHPIVIYILQNNNTNYTNTMNNTMNQYRCNYNNGTSQNMYGMPGTYRYQPSMMSYNNMQCNNMQYNNMQHNNMQYNNINNQYNTMQYNYG